LKQTAQDCGCSTKAALSGWTSLTESGGRVSTAATIHGMELWRRCGIIKLGKCRIKKTNADQRRHQEEHMALNAFALNVVMTLIALSIPALVFAGCIMTRKPETTPTPTPSEAAPPLELDRAA
jgi:hypothetical protein